MIEGDGRVLGVKFRPGGFKTFVNSSVCDLTNQVVLPETIFGQAFSKLEKNALATSDAAMAFELVDQFLIQRDPIGTPELDLVREIMTLIETDRSIKRADAIADQFSIGLRSLQRLFKQYVGVSPKWVIQRHRLIEAAERIRDGSPNINFADLALDLGYADQPHFIRDFKTMVGMTPANYLRSIRKP